MMKYEMVPDFENHLDLIQGKMRTLNGTLKKAVDCINEGKLIPQEIEKRIIDQLQSCREEEQIMTELAETLQVSVKNRTIAEIVSQVENIKAEENQIKLQNIIKDFFRLTAAAQDTLNALYNAKLNLQKICSLMEPEFSRELRPYSVVVQHTRSGEDLSEENYDLVQKALGNRIVRAVDRNQLIIDKSMDINPWMEGSSNQIHMNPDEKEQDNINRDSEQILLLDEFAEKYVEGPAADQNHINSESNIDQTAPEEETVKTDAPVGETLDITEEAESTASEASIIPGDAPSAEHSPWIHYHSYYTEKDFSCRMENDTSAQEAKSSKFINHMNENYNLYLDMSYLSNIMLYRTDKSREELDNTLTQKTLDAMLKRGYCAKYVISNKEDETTYYTLSSKGYACLKRSDAVRHIKLKYKTLLTAPIMEPAHSWHPVFAYRAALISDYIVSMMENRTHVINPGIPDADFAFTHEQDENGNYFMLATGIFEPGKEQVDLDIITEYLLADNHDTLVLLIRDQEDIPILHHAICVEHPEFSDSIRYVVITQPDVMYDGQIRECGLEKADESTEKNSEVMEEVETETNDAGEGIQYRSLSNGDITETQEEDSDDVTESTNKVEDEILLQKADEYLETAKMAFQAHRPDVGNVLFRGIDKYIPSNNDLTRKYAFASGDPVNTEDLRPSNLVKAFPEESGENMERDCLFAAAWMRMFFSQDIGNDIYMFGKYNYTEKNLACELSHHLVDLFYELGNWVKKQGRGIDSYMLEETLRHSGTETVVHECQRKAQELLNNGSLLTSSHYHARIKKTREILFGTGSDFDQYLHIVAEDNKNKIGIVRNGIKGYFQGENSIDRSQNSNLEKLMDDTWRQTSQLAKGSGQTSQLTGCERNTLRNQIVNLLSILADWVKYADTNRQISAGNSSSVVSIIQSIQPKLHSAIQELSKPRRAAKTSNAALTVLIDTLKEIENRINGEQREDDIKKYYYINLLKEPYVALGADYKPYIEEVEEQLEPFDFCKNVAQYLHSQDRTWEETIERLFSTNEHRTGGDYGCARVLQTYLDSKHPEVHWPAEYDIDRLVERALDKTNRRGDSLYLWEQNFTAKLEMADGDGWFTKTTEREQIERVRAACYETYCGQENFGFYGRKLLGMLQTAKEKASLLRPQYMQRLYKQMENRPDEESGAEIFGQIEKLIQSDRFGAAESYLQQAERGNLEITHNGLGDENSPFNVFWRQCGLLCQEVPINKKMVEVYRSRHRNMYNNTVETGEAMLHAWPENITNTGNISKLLTNLGLKGTVTKGSNQNCFSVSFPETGRVENYPHPIADFGSRMIKNGLTVITIFGKKEADTLFTEMNTYQQKAGNASILFVVNYAISLPERRKLAKKIASNIRISNPCLLLDRALIMYLAEKPLSERWNILIQCAIPFQPSQLQNPYYENSSVEIPPDMFIGRREELSSIINPNGANLIYGGRQLGKTALLQRARTLQHQPEQNSWSVYVDVKGMDSDKASQQIRKNLCQGGFLSENMKVSSWEELAECLEDRMMDARWRNDRLLLLIDEADILLNSFEQDGYQELDQFKRLQNTTGGRFKFVMAGLHNVLRLSVKALDQNSGLPQLQGITVKPLSFSDARELLEIPLSYLGFMISAGEEDIIAQILYNTNYFPGLVHYYAYRLVKYMQQNLSVNMPPYILNRETLTRILADEDFRKLRVDRLKMTLGIDAKEHSYYDALAHLLCYCSLESEDVMLYGMTAGDIQKECRELSPESRIANLNTAQIEALLDELVDLNIFRREVTQGVNRYLFSRASFIEMLGSKADVENHLLEVLTR